ncbi:MAG: HD domain-containing protein, partial [Alkalispirochaetaceae bacterium]
MKVDAFLELFTLKDLQRTGWVLRGVEAPESVADHSWGTALLALRYAGEAEVDRERALSLAVAHDLIEVRVGDIPRRADPLVPGVDEDEKRRLEQGAARQLGAELDWPELESLWREYDEGESEAARFVRDMNLLDMVLQATLYRRENR